METLRSPIIAFVILLVLFVKRPCAKKYGGEFDSIKTELDLVKKIVNTNCLEDNPITEEMKNNAKKGILSEERNFKCYMKCSFAVFLLIDENDVINGTNLIEYYSDEHNELIRKVVKTCLPKSTKPDEKQDACESVFNYLKCSIKVDHRSVEFLPF